MPKNPIGNLITHIGKYFPGYFFYLKFLFLYPMILSIRTITATLALASANTSMELRQTPGDACRPTSSISYRAESLQSLGLDQSTTKLIMALDQEMAEELSKFIPAISSVIPMKKIMMLLIQDEDLVTIIKEFMRYSSIDNFGLMGVIARTYGYVIEAIMTDPSFGQNVEGRLMAALSRGIEGDRAAQELTFRIISRMPAIGRFIEAVAKMLENESDLEKAKVFTAIFGTNFLKIIKKVPVEAFAGGDDSSKVFMSIFKTYLGILPNLISANNISVRSYAEYNQFSEIAKANAPAFKEFFENLSGVYRLDPANCFEITYEKFIGHIKNLVTMEAPAGTCDGTTCGESEEVYAEEDYMSIHPAEKSGN